MKTTINELKIRHKEFFESQLATHLLKHPEYFPAVHKISASIINLMTIYQNKVIQLIGETPKIIEELQEPYFGASLSLDQPSTKEHVYQNMIHVLNGGYRDLSEILQIHCVFIHRIYDNLEQPDHKADLVKIIFPLSIFNKKYYHRTEKKITSNATHAQGITKNNFFSKKVVAHQHRHIRALDKFEFSEDSPFSKFAMEHTLPTVCGPSGHTGSLMLGAKLYGELTPEELNEYALASFSFLASGGNHSFHEVYLIASLLGVTYDIDDYEKSIPSHIANAHEMQALREQFSMYLK